MKSELTPLMVFVTAVVALTLITALVVPPASGSPPIVVGHNTTIIAENGITLDNLVASDTVMLQDNVKLYLNTAKTVGLQYNPDIGVPSLFGPTPCLSAVGRLQIQANTGIDGAGSWDGLIDFGVDGSISISWAGDKTLGLTGGVLDINAALASTVMQAGATVDGVDVGSHRHSGGAGDGPVLDGDNCLKDENLNLGTGSLTTTHTIARHLIISSSNFGKPVTDPPVVDVYGIWGTASWSS